jgi:threonine synthase
MWRYREVLPIAENEQAVSLGEGATPLVALTHLETQHRVYVKDEAQNPTGSFKSRGMSTAVTVAKRLGAVRSLRRVRATPAARLQPTARAPGCRLSCTFPATRRR